jgi:hypothetical protein
MALARAGTHNQFELGDSRYDGPGVHASDSYYTRRQHRTRSPGVPLFPAIQVKRTHIVAHIVTLTMATTMAMSGVSIPRLLHLRHQLDR